MNTTWQFATAGTIRFGRGCSSSAVNELLQRGVTRPLLVSDPVVLRLPPVQTLVAALQRAGVSPTIFSDCVAEPPVTIAEAAAKTGRRAGVNGVLAIGGGSNMDVAKMASVLLMHGGEPKDYFGFDKVPGAVLPLIALPTTAGTGSEVSHSAVLTDAQAAVKVSSLSRWLRPTAAIIDPCLSDSCPAQVTAHSGIDALVHAIEAVTNRDFSQMPDGSPETRAYEGSYPFTQLLGAEAIRLIGRFLVRAYRNSSDIEARDAMAWAATLAGMAFSNSGVALVHALEYPVGASVHCSHGEGNGLLLPHVMRFNLPACTERMAEVAAWLGCETPRMSTALAAESAIDRVLDFQQQLGIRTRLRQLGVRSESLPEMAHKSFQIKRLMDVNPRLPSESDLLEILQAAF